MTIGNLQGTEFMQKSDISKYVKLEGGCFRVGLKNYNIQATFEIQ